MAYQSLYRRYRPQKFGEIVGQEHVVRALKNAVAEDRVGHAYLLSGPRGTGKTTAARILAKVLNCTNAQDGEPCGECESCISIESGTSFDLHELDAASNNKVDDIRDLLSKVALGTPGRSKVYLLDEVHMLTSGAENALLKTLEEPPDHVIFVLATTEPHKVVPTIRSRTQHLSLTLIPAEQMVELVREIAADAGLEVDDASIDHVVKVGGGSARDTLSALDQVVAAGGVGDVDNSTGDLLEALATSDAGLALSAIESASSLGIDPRRIGERFLDGLRSVFLVKMGAVPPRMSEPERALADRYQKALSPATLTRSLETVGSALVDMRQAPDPRIDLEVAFVKICEPKSSTDLAALTQRIDALEHALATGGVVSAPTAAPVASNVSAIPAAQETAPAPTRADAPSTEQQSNEPAAAVESAPVSPSKTGSRPADAARAALKPRSGATATTPPADVPRPEPAPTTDGRPPLPPSMRDNGPSSPAPVQSTPDAQQVPPPAEPVRDTQPHDSATHHNSAADVAEPTPAQQPSDDAPQIAKTADGEASLSAIQQGWTAMLDGQSTPARARFLAGNLASLDGQILRFELPSDAQLQRCEKYRGEVEAAVQAQFGAGLTLQLAVGDGGTPPRPGPSPAGTVPVRSIEDMPADEDVDLTDLTDADVNQSAVSRITDVFPGAEVLPENNP